MLQFTSNLRHFECICAVIDSMNRNDDSYSNNNDVYNVYDKKQ